MKQHPPIAHARKPLKQPASSKTRENGRLMTLNEATTFLNCHRVTLLRLIKRGQLHLMKSGSTWTLERAEITALNNRNIAIYPHLTTVRSSK